MEIGGTITSQTIAVGNMAAQYLNYNNVGSIAGYNLFLGAEAGRGIVSQGGNTIVGMNSLDPSDGVLNCTSSYITTLGYEAGRYTTGSYNTFVGALAGKGGQTSAPYSSGDQNTALGWEALSTFTTGDTNVAVGARALKQSTTATNNTAMGFRAGYNTTTGGGNIFIGTDAGYSLTTDTACTIVGYSAGAYLVVMLDIEVALVFIILILVILLECIVLVVIIHS